MASVILALARYFLECDIKRLVQDCSLNPEKKGKAILNLLKRIPFSSGNESKEAESINVVTRAQALKDVAQ